MKEDAILLATQKSPFWRRTYGGYTVGQIRFIETLLGRIHGKKIYDPMSGQANALAPMAWNGAIVHASDHNPAPLCLAYLRRPSVLSEAPRLVADLEGKLNNLKRREKRPNLPEYCDNFVPYQVRHTLETFFKHIGVTNTQTPFEPGAKFWLQDSTQIVPVSLAVLAARAITCFRSTDNATWLRKGGVTPRWKVADALLQVLRSWAKFAGGLSTRSMPGGDLKLATWDAMSPPKWHNGLMDAIVVSPPYANRLDYTSLWSPELAILATVFGADLQLLKAAQLGTTVVSDRFPSDEEVAELPRSTVKTLKAIRSDPIKFSDIYYYPFFANYAIGLRRSVISWAKSIRKKGKLLVFIRNTVRKDHLFRADDLVTDTAAEMGFTLLEGGDATHIIRAHVGLLRTRRTRPGVHGSAQVERWLAFKKL